MKFSDKIVTSIPLEIIWTEQQEVVAKRLKYLSTIDIKQLLNQSKLHFVVAEVGNKLRWIDLSQCFDFWKLEVEKHLADDVDKINLDIYTHNYAYIASQWTEENGAAIVLLEKFS